jgi:DNA-binding NarL/FixJ family response regulator
MLHKSDDKQVEKILDIASSDQDHAGRLIVFKKLETLIGLSMERQPAEWNLRIKLADYGLSKRQQQVAVWVIRGLSNREIERRLFVAEQTVKDHLHEVFGMVTIRRRSELAAKLFGVGSA